MQGVTMNLNDGGKAPVAELGTELGTVPRFESAQDAQSWLVQQAQYDLAHVRRDRIKLKRLEIFQALSVRCCLTPVFPVPWRNGSTFLARR